MKISKVLMADRYHKPPLNMDYLHFESEIKLKISPKIVCAISKVKLWRQYYLNHEENQARKQGIEIQIA